MRHGLPSGTPVTYSAAAAAVAACGAVKVLCRYLFLHRFVRHVVKKNCQHGNASKRTPIIKKSCIGPIILCNSGCRTRFPIIVY